MSEQLLASLAIFVLAILVGFEVISKVPATLHTPLMSGANSIHGIVLVGAMLIAAAADDPLSYLLAFTAMVFGAANVVGGYVVTDRMLQMFRRRPAAATPAQAGVPGAPAAPGAAGTPGAKAGIGPGTDASLGEGASAADVAGPADAPAAGIPEHTGGAAGATGQG